MSIRSTLATARKFLPFLAFLGTIGGGVGYVAANTATYEKEVACKVTSTLTIADEKGTRTNVHGTCAKSDISLMFARIDGAAPPIGTPYTCTGTAILQFGTETISAIKADSCKRS